MSTEYVDANTHLLWKCGDCGYEWYASPDNIKNNLSGKNAERGTWCPNCAGNIKGTIEEMQTLAKPRGGECLSKEYLGSKEPLKWRCGNCNYEWFATPNYLKSFNKWCPQCYNKNKK